jgi:hypothetical protein
MSKLISLSLAALLLAGCQWAANRPAASASTPVIDIVRLSDEAYFATQPQTEGRNSSAHQKIHAVHVPAPQLGTDQRRLLPSYLPAGFSYEAGLASVIHSEHQEHLAMFQLRNQDGDMLFLERDPYRGDLLKWPVGEDPAAVTEVVLSDGTTAYLLNGEWRVRRGEDGPTFQGWWTWGVTRLLFLHDGWLYQIRSYSVPELSETRRSDVIDIANSWLETVGREQVQ